MWVCTGPAERKERLPGAGSCDVDRASGARVGNVKVRRRSDQYGCRRSSDPTRGYFLAAFSAALIWFAAPAKAKKSNSWQRLTTGAASRRNA